MVRAQMPRRPRTTPRLAWLLDHLAIAEEQILGPWHAIPTSACFYCCAPNPATRDHFLPRMLGGQRTVPACARCNAAKGQQAFSEFAASRYFRRVVPPERQQEFAAMHDPIRVKLAQAREALTGR